MSETYRDYWKKPMVEDPPDGNYMVCIKMAEPKMSDSGVNSLSLRGQITDGPFEGEWIGVSFFYETEFGMRMLKRAMNHTDEALLTIEDPDEAMARFCDTIVDCVVLIAQSENKKNPQYKNYFLKEIIDNPKKSTISIPEAQQQSVLIEKEEIPF